MIKDLITPKDEKLLRNSLSNFFNDIEFYTDKDYWSYNSMINYVEKLDEKTLEEFLGFFQSLKDFPFIAFNNDLRI